MAEERDEDAVTPEEVAASLAERPASADKGKPGQDDARAAARRTQAVRLRLAGLTYEQIAEQAGYSDRHAARQTVLRALRSVEAESVNELRAVENSRLERATAAVWPKVLSGDVKALLAWLKVSERLARLNGLDAPVQVAISAGVAGELEDALSLLEQAVVLGEVVDSRDDDDRPALEG